MHTAILPTIITCHYDKKLEFGLKKQVCSVKIFTSRPSICLLVLFILLTRGTSDVKHRAIVIQTQFRRYRQYHIRLFFMFSPVYAVVKQTPVLSFQRTQRRNAHYGHRTINLAIISSAL